MTQQEGNLDQILRGQNFLNRQSKYEVLPIEAKASDWPVLRDDQKTFLKKEYVIADFENFLYFVSQVLKLANRKGHHPDINLSHNSVDIELYTHDINDVTEIDLEMASMIDEIYEDIYFIENHR